MPAWLQRDWCSSFVLALGHFVWQGTLIAIVLAIALRATKAVAVRYWLSLAALLLMAACPIVTLRWLMQPESHVATLDAPPFVREEPAPSQPMMPPAPAEATSDVGHVSNVPASSPVPPLDFTTVTTTPPQPPVDDRSWWQKFAPQLTTAYLCGVALMLLRLVFGLWGGRRLRRRVHLIDDPSLLEAMQRQATALGLKLLPILAYCERVTVPTVVGVLKPMILLPLTLTSGLSPEQMESVLAHELAHLRRYDHLVNLLQRVIESLLFFHPALWWVSHRIRDEREHCCDDLVVACGALPLDYAKSLLVVAELSRRGRETRAELDRSVAAVSLLATGPQKPSNLRQRIARLLGESATPSLRLSPRALVLSAAVALSGLAMLMSLGISDDQAATRDDGDTAATPAKFSPKLPNGVTVELIGVSRKIERNANEEWWLANGELLPKSPLGSFHRERFVSADYRTFAVQALGAKHCEVWLQGTGIPGTTDSRLYHEGDKLLHLTAAGPYENAKTTSVLVGVATDDWGPVQQLRKSGELLNSPELPPWLQAMYHRVRFRNLISARSTSSLQLSWPGPHDQAQFEIWAIDTDNKRHEPTGHGRGDQSWQSYDFDLTETKIDRFEFRLRPYRHRVTFENVSLKPGLQTDVKVKVESLPDEKPRAGRGSPDPALDPTAGLPKSDEETNPPNNANGDLRSNPAAEAGDPRRVQDGTRINPRDATRLLKKRLSADPKTRTLELIYILRQYRVFSRDEEWAQAIRELARIGQPAVSELIDELDRTDRDAMLRSLGIALRAMNDPRAVPALIRAIPKTLRPAGSDCGMHIRDPELREFLQKNELHPNKDHVSVDRPVNEILNALERLTGHHWPEGDRDPLRHVFLGPPETRAERSKPFLERQAHWQEWWAGHGKDFLTAAELRSLEQPATPQAIGEDGFDKVDRAGIDRFGQLFPTGAQVRLGPVHDVELFLQNYADAPTLLDFDRHQTRRRFEAALDGSESFPDWIHRTGVDVHCGANLMGDDTRVWVIEDSRWDTIDREVMQPGPLKLGNEPRGGMSHLKPDQKTLLFTTREGGSGILRLDPYNRETGSRGIRYRMWPAEPTAKEAPPAAPKIEVAGVWDAPVKVVLQSPGADKKCAWSLLGKQSVALAPDVSVQNLDQQLWRGSEELTAWKRDNKVTFVVAGTKLESESGGVQELLSVFAFDCLSREVRPQAFADLTVAMATQILSESRQKELRSTDSFVGNPSGLQPQTRLFLLADGTIGLLQITKADKKQDVLEFQYKLARINPKKDGNADANGDLRSNPAAGSGDPRRAPTTHVKHDETALRLAKSTAQVAKVEYEKMLNSNRKVPGSIPQSMIIHFRCQSEIADLQVTREELRAAEKETGEVDVAIARKTVEPLKFDLDLMVEANRKVRGAIPRGEVERAKLKYELALLDVQKAERRAKGQPTADLDVQSLRKQHDVAKAEYDQMLNSNRKVPGSLPQTELDRGRLAWERIAAELKLAQTRADQDRAGRGSPDLAPTAGSPESDKETNKTNNANGDLRSNPAAGPGDPRRAQVKIEPLPGETKPPGNEPDGLLGRMIERPSVELLRELLALAETTQPEPFELLDDGRRGEGKKGSRVVVANNGRDRFAIVAARVHPLTERPVGVRDEDLRLECAFVFDWQGRLLATLGGEIRKVRGTSVSIDAIDVLRLGPEEDWFVRVMNSRDSEPLFEQTAYYRIANPVIQSLRYFHYPNSNAWSIGPEERTSRFGTLYFDFPNTSDKFKPRETASTVDGVPVNREILWDGDRNLFVGAPALRAKNKPLYQVDTNWSKEFEPLSPKRDQLVVTGGMDKRHVCNWAAVVPDGSEAVVTLTIPQRTGPPNVVERRIGPALDHFAVLTKPHESEATTRVRLWISGKEEAFDIPFGLGRSPEPQPIVRLLNPGNSAQLLSQPLKSSPEPLRFEIKLLAKELKGDLRSNPAAGSGDPRRAQ